jgi:cyclopropane fatty-acyl-phospholipid synthase-like methyltransferase
MNEFDIKATSWDKNKVHMERAQFIANQLMELVPFSPDMKAMDFGAGTGLMSFILKDLFTSVTLIDNSQEMIRICNEKIAESKSNHIHSIKIDLETEDLEERFDIIFSQMAFHHIGDINKMLNKFFSLLNEGGILAVADLFSEDGSFHGEGFTGHKGFDPEWLAGKIKNAGFKDVRYVKSFIQKRVDPDGKTMEYPLFLMIAKKLTN